MYKCIFVIIVGVLLCSVSCQKTDPVSVQTTEENTDQVEGDLFKRACARGLTVMTRNVYVGTTTEGLMMAENPAEIPLLATEAFQLLQATNFPERVGSIIGMDRFTLFAENHTSRFYNGIISNMSTLVIPTKYLTFYI